MVYSAIKKDEIITLPSTGRKIEVIILSEVGETWVQSLGWEDPMEKGKATESSILAWRIPWIEDGRLQSMGLQRRKGKIYPSECRVSKNSKER